MGCTKKEAVVVPPSFEKSIANARAELVRLDAELKKPGLDGGARQEAAEARELTRSRLKQLLWQKAQITGEKVTEELEKVIDGSPQTKGGGGGH